MSGALLQSYMASFRIEPVRGGDQRALLRMRHGEAVAGRPGFLHGGALIGLLEAAARRLARRSIAESDLCLLTMTTDFLRGARHIDTFANAACLDVEGGPLLVEACAWQEDPDKLVAKARFRFVAAQNFTAPAHSA